MLQAGVGGYTAAGALELVRLFASYAATPLPDGIAPTADGTIRTHPGLVGDAGGCDGFFVAALRRNG